MSQVHRATEDEILRHRPALAALLGTQSVWHLWHLTPELGHGKGKSTV